jgi:hypothetical protein
MRSSDEEYHRQEGSGCHQGPFKRQHNGQSKGTALRNESANVETEPVVTVGFWGNEIDSSAGDNVEYVGY